MGYHPTKTSIQKVELYLNLLSSTEGDSLVFQTDNPTRLVYSLNRALASVEAFVDEYPQFMHIRKGWKLTEKKLCVLATRRSIDLVKLEATEVIDAVDAVSYLIKLGEHFDSIHFPNFVPTDEQLEDLFRYTVSHGLVIRKNTYVFIEKGMPTDGWTLSNSRARDTADDNQGTGP